MRSRWLGLGVAGVLGCGSDTVEPVLRCVDGPSFTASVEPCEVIVEGSGGPTSARLITIGASDGTAWTEALPWAGGLILADEGPALVVARLGPGLELEWSRELVHDAEQATLGPLALDPAGVDVVARLGPSHESTSWLMRLDDAGRCSDATQIVLDDDPRPRVHALVRAGDQLVLGGLVDEARAIVQLRSSSAAIAAETELSVDWGWIEQLELHTGGPSPYLAHYRAYAPQGYWSFYFGQQWLDETLASTGTGVTGVTHLGYQNDASGRLYGLARNAWDEAPDEPPATSITVTPHASETSPGGDARVLAIPQPECGWVRVYVRDEALQVAHCGADESLLGYAGGETPAWTATLMCPDADALDLGRMRFDAEGRLWAEGSLDGRRVVALLEW